MTLLSLLLWRNQDTSVTFYEDKQKKDKTHSVVARGHHLSKGRTQIGIQVDNRQIVSESEFMSVYIFLSNCHQAPGITGGSEVGRQLMWHNVKCNLLRPGLGSPCPGPGTRPSSPESLSAKYKHKYHSKNLNRKKWLMRVLCMKRLINV